MGQDASGKDTGDDPLQKAGVHVKKELLIREKLKVQKLTEEKKAMKVKRQNEEKKRWKRQKKQQEKFD